MARLNARQRRAHKVRVALNELAQSRNAPIVALSGDIRSMSDTFKGGKHKADHGTYKVPAVRPTIVTGKRKSGSVSKVKASEVTISTVDHANRHNPGMVPAALIVRKGSPKLRLVAPKQPETPTYDERFNRAKRLKLLTPRAKK